MDACKLIRRNVEGGAASRTYVVTMPSSCLDRYPVEPHCYSTGVGKTQCTEPPTDAGANEQPSTRAITLTGTRLARCSRRISAQSSTLNTHFP